MTPKIHIIGRKNAGKTTLVCELVREFTSRGRRVGTVKHTHHHHEFDAPGKDSHAHREAGAEVVGLVGPKMSAAFRQHQGHDQTQGIESLMPLFAECELIIIEGQQDAQGLKFEVWRSETGQPPLACERSDIHAVISDDDMPAEIRLTWPRNPIADLADRISELLKLDVQS